MCFSPSGCNYPKTALNEVCLVGELRNEEFFCQVPHLEKVVPIETVTGSLDCDELHIKRQILHSSVEFEAMFDWN